MNDLDVAGKLSHGGQLYVTSSKAWEQASFLTQILWSQAMKCLSVNLHISICDYFFIPDRFCDEVIFVG